MSRRGGVVDLGQLGRLLPLGGATLAVLGLALVGLARLLPGERLPGDLVLTRGPVSCFVPLAASLLLSVLLTILLNMWARR